MKKMKYYLITIVFISLATSRVEAEKLSKAYTELAGDLRSGNTIAVGKVIEENGKQYFIGKRGWTNIPKKFIIEKEFDFDNGWHKRGITGENYIFSSMEKTGINGEHRSDLYVLIPLKSNRIESDIERLSTLKMAPDQINPSWQFCKADKECIQLKNQCGNKIGVNSKYRKNYEDFLKTIKEKADCTNEVKSDQNSKCVEYFCS